MGPGRHRAVRGLTRRPCGRERRPTPGRTRRHVRPTPLTSRTTHAHPGVIAAVVGPRTLDQLDGLLAGAGLTPDGEVLDRVHAVVPPGTDLGPLDVSYVPPALRRAELRCRPADTRAAA
ncbi:hypothetical protein GA0115251_106493 [Streptomyces sp. TverLS-915]|uniref:hypothetical protein n=1 Tax=Streptomyces sp. TverLS-915 TaxID=1839763 RepID=UPI00081E2B45|nr:hypothetical protein [Streptomyces sp. TverLS-915]SCD38981.1 hypothetical protein GA0115251_106493 [Streptomyces sp. TverLS-915]